MLHEEITGRILGAAFEVHSQLGPGFLESVYEEALAHELGQRGIPYQRQVEVPIWYKGKLVGKHRLDLLVEETVIVELKQVQELAAVHKAITLAYLTATGLSVALLINFAKPSLDFKRLIKDQ